MPMTVAAASAGQIARIELLNVQKRRLSPSGSWENAAEVNGNCRRKEAKKSHGVHYRPSPRVCTARTATALGFSTKRAC